MKQKTEKINTLTQDLHTIKALQEETLREKSSLQVKHIQYNLRVQTVNIAYIGFYLKSKSK